MNDTIHSTPTSAPNADRSESPSGRLWRSAAATGVALGLLVASLEAVKNIPPTLFIHYRQPLHVAALSILFDLAVALSVALLFRPLMRFGRMAHATVCAAVVGGLIVAFPSEIPMLRNLERGMALALLLLLPLGVRFLSRPPARRACAVAALVSILVGYGLSYARPTVDWSLGHQRSTPPEAAPNVLLIVLDTVRADRLDLYGYHRPTFPELAGLAAEGAVFERAISAAPWTLPSHASFFTGLYPSSHGTHHERLKLDAEHETLAEVFRRYGWHTLALASNPWLGSSSGMTQGFAHQPPTWLAFTGRGSSFALRAAWELGWLPRDHGGESVARAWESWLREWDGERPFFAFLNFVESHIPLHDLPDPYLYSFTPEGWSRERLTRASESVQAAEFAGRLAPADDVARANDLYDGGVRYSGALTLRILDGLRQRGELDRTVLVIVSDHGDMLGEHDMYNHNRSLTDYLLRVPLIIRFPPRVPAGVHVREPVSTAALMPTILDLAGLPVPEGLPTRSFAPIFDGADPASVRSPLLSEVAKDMGMIVSKDFRPRGPFDRLGVRYRSIEEDGFKLIVDSEGGRWLFRPIEDPGESEELSERFPEVVAKLQASLATLEEAFGLGEIDRKTLDPIDARELDPEVRERLRSLGYVQ